MAAALGATLIAGALALGVGVAPGAAHAERAAKYRNDPVGYAKDILGIELWGKQKEILEALKKPNARVAVKSGHKVGKSNTGAVAAWWFYDCFTDARVVLTCVTSRQVDGILYREVRKLGAKSLEPIDGDVGDTAKSGVKSDDLREILGFTAKDKEAVAGVSGANVFYIPDEASGIDNALFEAMDGNRAGGGRILMLSNPTRTEGEFYDAFNSKSKFYTTFTISSEDSPNVVAGREVIPGLATREWVEEKKLEWGEDSPLFKVRVKGEFAENEDGKILSVHAIGLAESRWEETAAIGPLHVGIDPAGPAHGGDESGFAVRRGAKILELVTMRGVTEDAHVVHLLGILKTHAKPREQPAIVKVDSEGSVGAKVYYALRAHLEKPGHENDFILVRVRSSERAMREPNIYDRVRDELYAAFANWIREGGAIPTDTKLARELHAPEWFGLVTSRMKATSKDDLRKALGRSPDRADACMLSVWEPSSFAINDDGVSVTRVVATREEARTPVLNPYDASRAFNPYSGGR